MTSNRRVAVVGAGFAGLAVCWFLQQNKECQVTIFDAAGMGGGASAISAGLVHPYTGPEAKTSAEAQQAFHCSRDLIASVAKVDPDVILAHGILRVALSEEQQTSFHQRSVERTELNWLTSAATQLLAPGLATAPGLWIPDGLVLDSLKYLQGLWNLCEQQGAVLCRENVADLAQLDDYDSLVIAAGFSSRLFPQMTSHPIRGLKGQMIELEWPQSLPPLQLALNSDVYIIPTPATNSCTVGATFERNYLNEDVDEAYAQSFLRPKAEALVPALEGARLISCRAGIRATTPSHKPIATQINARVWALTGLGSKGLLYHAWLAQQLCEKLMK